MVLTSRSFRTCLRRNDRKCVNHCRKPCSVPFGCFGKVPADNPETSALSIRDIAAIFYQGIPLPAILHMQHNLVFKNGLLNFPLPVQFFLVLCSCLVKGKVQMDNLNFTRRIPGIRFFVHQPFYFRFPLFFRKLRQTISIIIQNLFPGIVASDIGDVSFFFHGVIIHIIVDCKPWRCSVFIQFRLHTVCRIAALHLKAFQINAHFLGRKQRLNQVLNLLLHIFQGSSAWGCPEESGK